MIWETADLLQQKSLIKANNAAYASDSANVHHKDMMSSRVVLTVATTAV